MKTSLHTIRFLSISILSLILFFGSCKKKNNNKEFKGNNKEVLTNWAEHIIIPSYTNYQTKVHQLVNDATNFENDVNENTFNTLKNSWLESYKAFQKVIIFNIGKAEKIYFLGMTNTYPTSIDSIQNNIDLIAQGNAGTIDLQPSFVIKKHTYQGFPALDYLLFHPDYTLEYYQTEQGKHAAKYIVMLARALENNVNKIVADWNNNKDNYINNTDNSVTGAYASTINAFLRGYEKDIRAAKVGYAAGAINAQNNIPAPQIIEAYYNGTVDKELLKIALQASQDFFNGKYFSNDETGKSLKSILEELDHKELVDNINEQYNIMYARINNMPNSLKETAVSDNAAMRDLYDDIQVNVAHYKTQMMAALKVQIGYQDTDGD